MTLKIDCSNRGGRPKLDAQGTWKFAVLDRNTFLTHTLELTTSYGNAVALLPKLLKERDIDPGKAQVSLMADSTEPTHRRPSRSRL